MEAERCLAGLSTTMGRGSPRGTCDAGDWRHDQCAPLLDMEDFKRRWRVIVSRAKRSGVVIRRPPERIDDGLMPMVADLKEKAWAILEDRSGLQVNVNGGTQGKDEHVGLGIKPVPDEGQQISTLEDGEGKASHGLFLPVSNDQRPAIHDGGSSPAVIVAPLMEAKIDGEDNCTLFTETTPVIAIVGSFRLQSMKGMVSATADVGFMDAKDCRGVDLDIMLDKDVRGIGWSFLRADDEPPDPGESLSHEQVSGKCELICLMVLVVFGIQEPGDKNRGAIQKHLGEGKREGINAAPRKEVVTSTTMLTPLVSLGDAHGCERIKQEKEELKMDKDKQSVLGKRMDRSVLSADVLNVEGWNDGGEQKKKAEGEAVAGKRLTGVLAGANKEEDSKMEPKAKEDETLKDTTDAKELQKGSGDSASNHGKRGRLGSAVPTDSDARNREKDKDQNKKQKGPDRVEEENNGTGGGMGATGPGATGHLVDADVGIHQKP